MKLVGGRIPVVVVLPHEAAARPVPFLLWFHGRTVTKELDSGRYLRLLRAGIGCVAVDLPGHGERFDAAMQKPEHTLEIVLQAAGEIDDLLHDLATIDGLDRSKTVIGGMSAGGMVSMVRGCSPHGFAGMLLECSTGDWNFQRARAMYRADLVAAHNPVDHLHAWREIPVLALHATHDEWVAVEGQRHFIGALQARATQPEQITLHEYESTGAAYEHMGFGRVAPDAKTRATAFVAECVGLRAPA